MRVEAGPGQLQNALLVRLNDLVRARRCAWYGVSSHVWLQRLILALVSAD
jgi:hypothetical protein